MNVPLYPSSPNPFSLKGRRGASDRNHFGKRGEKSPSPLEGEGDLGGEGSIGVQGLGISVPPEVVTADDLAVETGIPAQVLRQKFGIRQLHRAGPDCHVSDMAVAAGQAALKDAAIAPDEVDLLVYCGSEYKDFIVWSAAAKIAHLLGCRHAQVFEVYALCAGTPVTLRIVKNMMLAEAEIETALVVAASKESALIDHANERTRFMFNFGDGAGAAVLRRGLDRNLILGSASVVDSSLSDKAIRMAGGSRSASVELAAVGHYLDVPDLDGMRTRLDAVSGINFLRVAHQALRRSGCEEPDLSLNPTNAEGRRIRAVDFLAPVHVKRSMHDWLQRELGAPRAVYLEDYGHMQAADQLVALHEGREHGLLRDGDVAVLLAAGVGYTWAATAVRWGKDNGD